MEKNLMREALGCEGEDAEVSKELGILLAPQLGTIRDLSERGTRLDISEPSIILELLSKEEKR